MLDTKAVKKKTLSLKNAYIGANGWGFKAQTKQEIRVAEGKPDKKVR
jgi:hypothetical protein